MGLKKSTTPDPAKPPSKEELALIGIAILKRYRHPGNWIDGNTTNKVEHREMMLLKVEEIRRGSGRTVSADEAVQNAQAILAWAELLKFRLTKDIWVDQRVGMAPYVAVPKNAWGKVLPELKTLNRL
jgi:hypothetical protein